MLSTSAKSNEGVPLNPKGARPCFLSAAGAICLPHWGAGGLYSRDLELEPRFRTPKLLFDHGIRSAIFDHGIRSAINVLVKTKGDAFGVLEVDSLRRDEFGDSDRAFFCGLANTLAVAIRAQEREDIKSQMLREKESPLRDNEQLLRDEDMVG